MLLGAKRVDPVKTQVAGHLPLPVSTRIKIASAVVQDSGVWLVPELLRVKVLYVLERIALLVAIQNPEPAVSHRTIVNQHGHSHT